MSKYLLLLIATLSLQFGTAQVNFFEGSWAEVNAAAKEAGKPIFLKAYTDWCYWCKVMDKETLTDEAVYTYLNENFISYKADFEKGEGIDLAMKYRVTGFPTILYFAADGKLMEKSVGYDDDNAAFVEELKGLVAGNTAYRYPFEADLKVDYPEFYTKSFGPRKTSERPDKETVTAYLEAEEDLFSEVAWSVLYRFPLNDKFQDHVLENAMRYKMLFGPTEVRGKIESIVYGRVNQATKDQDESKFTAALEIINSRHFGDDAAEIKQAYGIFYYQKIGDWTRFSTAIDEMMANKEVASSRINGWSWTLYEECDNQEVLNKALGWMAPVVKEEPTYAYLDTYAALLFKTGDLAAAETWAAKAIEQAKADGEGHEETDALLEKIRAAGSN